jgi:hypothetical protein
MDKRCYINVPGVYRLRGRIVAPLLDRAAFFSGAAGAKAVLGPRIVRYIEDYYRESNLALQRDLGLPLERYGYPL